MSIASHLATTEFAIWLSVFHLLMHRLSGADDVVVGTDTHGRSNHALAATSGFFVNQLALRSSLSADDTVETYLHRQIEELHRALTYQDVPFDMIVDALGLSRDASYAPLFQVKFLYQASTVSVDGFPGLTAELMDTEVDHAQFDLTFRMESGNVLSAYFAQDILHGETTERWMALFLQLAKEVTTSLDSPVARLLDDHLFEQQCSAIRFDRKDHADVNIVASLARSMDRFADNIAVISERGDMTYAQLAGSVASLVERLSGLRVGPGARVGICLGRSEEHVVAMLAVLFLGGVFVPIDPSYPESHREAIVEGSDVSLIITTAEMAEHLDSYYGAILRVDSAELKRTSRPLVCDYVRPGGEPAYIIFTSGTTGAPKGSLISHEALFNLCDWYASFADIRETSRVMLMIPVGFDAAYKNILAPLMNGAAVVLSGPGAFIPSELLDQVAENTVTVLNCVPSVLQALVAADRSEEYRRLRTLSVVAVGGESLRLEPLRGWLECTDPRTRLANIYGPTECADICVANIGDARYWLDSHLPSIGWPIPNVRVFIVDENLVPCGVGVDGEILVTGMCVGLGYVDQRMEGGSDITRDMVASTEPAITDAMTAWECST